MGIRIRRRVRAKTRTGVTLILAVLSSVAVAGCQVPASSTLPPRAAIIAAAEKAAAYYRPILAVSRLQPKTGWSWATYEQGVLSLYPTTGKTGYRADALSWAQQNGWAIDSVETNPDNVKAGQVYYGLRQSTAAASLAAIDQRMASDLRRLPVSQYDWADALFMGLPAWAQWANRTGNSAYLTKLDQLYGWTRDHGAESARCATGSGTKPHGGLFDAAQGLWWRDCRFVSARDASGKPVLWSRGNGWVMAALTQVLLTMGPTSPRAAPYVSMLKTMAAHVAPLQGVDGFWRANLADAAQYPAPETSGTALIAYALAYGVSNHLLDRATYLPVIAKAWNGMSSVALQRNGFLSDCQGVGDAPAAPYTAPAPRTAPTSTSAGTADIDSPPFCVGALLLAGSSISRLAS